MGIPDVSLKNWLGQNARFADLFNAIIFHGYEVIQPDKLMDVRNESDLVVGDKNNKKRGESRFRDIVKKYDDSITLVILTCEIQDKIHYAMPVRMMLYDSLSYIDQARKLWEALDEESKRNVSKESFLSKFKKGDILFPVITLILYYGDEEWDGSVELYQMFGELASCEWIKEYVSNYKINLVHPQNIEDYSIFKSDLQMIFPMLKYKNSRKDMMEYINNNHDFFQRISTEDVYAIEALLGAGSFWTERLDTQKEVQDMCKAFEDIYKDGVTEGIEQGIEQGIEKSILLLRKVGTSEEMILELISTEYSLSEDEALSYVSKN